MVLAKQFYSFIALLLKIKACLPLLVLSLPFLSRHSAEVKILLAHQDSNMVTIQVIDTSDTDVSDTDTYLTIPNYPNQQ